MPSFKSSEPLNPTPEDLGANVAQKIVWFLSKGYQPHIWQLLFHGMTTDGNLTRFRHLVAGRRGGKTLSAAWEILFYCLFPHIFHLHAHGLESNKKLWIWVVTKDYQAGRPALLTFRDVLKEAGLEDGIDYKENRGHRYFEFDNALVEFKTADDPESLRGAGLDILWLDEAAFIPNDAAWRVVRPALSDKLGLVISTTTPAGKNWFYDEFWSEDALRDKNVGRIEYRSKDRPNFSEDEWEYAKRTMHPMVFKQEYEASFDSMAGIELPGDWLQYFDSGDIPKDEETGEQKLRKFIGIDPAISQADGADRFAMTLIGVADGSGDCFLLEQYAGHLRFPEQIDKIRDWNLKYRPMAIGIESNAYQVALVQQISRLSDFIPVIPQIAKGKKSDRILSMSPVFRVGKVKIKRSHTDFIDEWINYNSAIKNPKDDCLDSMDIALRTAGVLLPTTDYGMTDDELPAADMDELARRDRGSGKGTANWGIDEHMGEW